MNYNAVIIDDERDAIELIAHYVYSLFPQINLVGRAQYPDELTPLLTNTPPDILFLDIKLIGLTGFDILEHMKFPDSVHVIFITAYENYAIKAFEQNAAGYLMKPVTPATFKKTVVKTLEKINAYRVLHGVQNELIQKYAIPANKDFVLTGINEILFCQASGSYTFFFLVGGKKIIATKAIGEIERNLPSDCFVRAHQSYLVNIHHIIEFDHTQNLLTLTDKTTIPVSRRQKKTIKDLLRSGIVG